MRRNSTGPASAEQDRGDLRDAATRAARSGGWVSSNGPRPSRVRFSNKALDEFFRLERELYAMRSASRRWISHDLRPSASDSRFDCRPRRLHEVSGSKLPQVRTSEEQAVPRSIVLARALMTAQKAGLTVPALLATFSKPSRRSNRSA